MYPYPVQPDPAAVRSKDESDLNTLSILHYVWTGLMGCSSLGLVGYFVLLGALVAGAPASTTTHGSHAAQAEVSVMLIVFGVIMVCVTIPLLVLHFLAAQGLKRRTRYTLVMVMAGFTCLSVPLGTGLGIWTFMVLGRPSVKALFGRA